MSREKDVSYSFEADISGLESAIKEAANMFQVYEDSLKTLGEQAQELSEFHKLQESIAVSKALVDDLKAAFLQFGDVDLTKLPYSLDAMTTALYNMGLIMHEFREQIGPSFDATPMTTQLDAINEMLLKTQPLLEVATNDILANKDSLKLMGDEAEELAKDLEEVASSTNIFTFALNKLKAGLTRVGSGLKAFMLSFISFKWVVTSLKGLWGILFSFASGRFFADAIKESVAYVEHLNLFNVAFGTASESGHRFIDVLQEVYGLDPSLLYDQAGQFFNLAAAVGMPVPQARTLAVHLTRLGVELSSLFNMPVETVMKNMQSGMQGMTRAVRKYGMDVRMVTLEQTAMSLGIKQEARNMTEANRQGLRLITMYRQAAKALGQNKENLEAGTQALGDFARTMEMPANQMKILKQQIAQFKRSVGNFFIGAMAPILQYLNGLIMAGRMVFEFLIDLFSPKTAQPENTFLDSIPPKVEEAESALKSLMAPFDELNVLNADTGGDFSPTSLDVLDPRIQAEMDRLSLSLEGIQMRATAIRNQILEFLGFDLKFKWDEEFGVWVFESMSFDVEKLIDNIQKLTGVSIRPLVDIFKNLWAQLKGFNDTLKPILVKGFNDVILPLIGWMLASVLPTILRVLIVVAKFIVEVIRFLTPLIVWIWDYILGPLIEGIGYWANYFTEKMQGVEFSWAALWGWIKDNFGKAMTWIVDGISWVMQAILQFVWDIPKHLLSIFWVLAGWLFDVLQYALGWTIRLLATWLGAIVMWMINGLLALGAKWEEAWTKISEFFVGVWEGFKGIMTRAWESFKQFFKDLAVSYHTHVVEPLTKWWNELWDGARTKFRQIWTGIKDFAEGIINGILGFISDLIGSIQRGIDRLKEFIGLNNSTSTMGVSTTLNVYHSRPGYELASGGVVRRPIVAMVGEGGVSEAVIPLGGSPEMRQLVDEIARAVSGSGGASTSQDQKVEVYIGDKQWDAFTYKSNVQGQKLVGATPLGGNFRV